MALIARDGRVWPILARPMHRNVLTSVALDRDLVEAIKKAAEERGVPYQVLLRMLIIDGFKSWQKSA